MTDKPPARRNRQTNGLACPRCGCRDLRAVYVHGRGGTYRRARECRHCGRRAMTVEAWALRPPPDDTDHEEDPDPAENPGDVFQ